MGNQSLIGRVKRIIDAAAICAMIGPVVFYKLSALLIGPGRAFPGWSQLLSLLPGFAGIYLRRAFYRLVLPACGRDVCVSFGTVFSHPTAALGERVYIGIGCMVGEVTLENDVLIGSHVSIINGRCQHGIDRLDIPIREQPGEYPRVVIGQDAWIGDRAVVTTNVGRHSVVGAAAVVTRPVPDFAIAVGNPARVQRFRNQVDAVGYGHSSRETSPGFVSENSQNANLVRPGNLEVRRE